MIKRMGKLFNVCKPINVVMRLHVKCAILILASLLPALSTASQELPSAKLKCSGYAWVDGQRYDLNDGFIDLNKNAAIVRGFGIPDGNYTVIPKSVREDFLSIKNNSKPMVVGNINRISGRVNFIENSPTGNLSDGKLYFLGDCIKARPLF